MRFADAVATLRAQGASTYLELGPDPVLCAMARECLGEEQDRAAFIPTLREGRTEAEAITTAIGNAHVSGAKLDWGAFFKGTGASGFPCPPIRSSVSATGSIHLRTEQATRGCRPSAAGHPLLGAAVELADAEGGGLLLTGRLSLATHSWLADHQVVGSRSCPAPPSWSWPCGPERRQAPRQSRS